VGYTRLAGYSAFPTTGYPKKKAVSDYSQSYFTTRGLRTASNNSLVFIECLDCRASLNAGSVYVINSFGVILSLVMIRSYYDRRKRMQSFLFFTVRWHILSRLVGSTKFVCTKAHK
jgi:hypothetical protein